MNSMQEAKIQKLLDLLEETKVIMKRSVVTCEQIEKEFRSVLNDEELPPAA